MIRSHAFPFADEPSHCNALKAVGYLHSCLICHSSIRPVYVTDHHAAHSTHTMSCTFLYFLTNCLSYQVTVLGTPAEEDGGGTIDLLREGAFEGMDVVFMAHPSQEDATYIPDVADHE